MSTTHITIVKCDRCKEEIRDVHYEQRIGHLRYMVMRNGSGTMNSNMSLDLCASCTTEFRAWWAEKP